MAQHDYVINNDTAANVRVDLNNALAAIATVNSGATAPSVTYAHMLWMDTSGASPVLRIRNAANSAWLALDEVIGMSETGLALANSISQEAARNALGATATGTSLFTAASVSAAQTLLSITIFSQALAEGGTNNSIGIMTPLRVTQLVAARAQVGASVTLSGAAVDFTGIPASANEITFQFREMARSGTQRPLLQAIVGGSAVTTGYYSNGGALYGSTPVTSEFLNGFGILNDNAGPDVLNGTITLRRFAAGSNVWIAEGQILGAGSAVQGMTIQGDIALAGTLAGLRFTGNGSTFTAGSAAIKWRI